MNLSEIEQNERIAILAGLALVSIVFLYGLYSYINPPIEVWEGKVFGTSVGDKNTFIYSYGNGKLKVPGVHEFELEATYRITYQSRNRFVATIIHSIEKIDG